MVIVFFEEEEESGIVGTGLYLQGTVNDSLFTDGTVVEAYSSDGQRDEIAINSDRSFNTDSLNGEAPWVLRVQINADRELYGMAYSDGNRNINAFSDVSLRRWLALRSLKPDDILYSPAQAANLPSSAEYDETVDRITELLDLVFESYGISNTDIISTTYLTDDTGIDRFLRRNNVVIENDSLTFQVTDPKTNLQTEIRSSTELASDSVDSGNGPSQPGSVRALSGGMERHRFDMGALCR